MLSRAVLAEVRDVLSRPKLLRKYPQLDSPVVAEFLASVTAKAEFLDPVPETISYPRDPNDQPYPDLVVAAGADFLVSRDQDLLDLQSPESELGQELRRQAPKLVIINPVELLRRVASTGEES